MIERMKRKRFPWVPVLASALAVALLGNTIFVIDSIERNRVVSVPDGDSLQLKDGRRVRLLGIDAPERGRCMADEARTKLVELAQGRHVRLKNVVTDSYGRMLANVIVKGWPLARALLAAGLARNRSSMSNHIIKCSMMQKAAKSEKYYYLPDCRQYPQVLVDRAFGDSWFCTEEEAMKAGFTKSAMCVDRK